jgi:hypothetical protein
MRLPTFIATSVVRGSKQGESHGGIYTIDFENQACEQHVDWNTSQINFEGRGADRGLRGIAFDGDDIFVAASNELFCYDRDFNIQSSFRNRYLKHCHEIVLRDRHIFMTSTGFDSLLAFDLDQKKFVWGFHLVKPRDQWSGFTFDPLQETGPRPINNFHINNVYADDTGIYISGVRTAAMLYLNSKYAVSEVCTLPLETHNARPFREGVLFNDTARDAVRYIGRDARNQAFRIKTYPESEIQFSGIDDSKIARQGFGRGLCPVDKRFIAGGSSPSTITLYDLKADLVVASVNLSMDIRNAIHGLEVWPYT